VLKTKPIRIMAASALGTPQTPAISPPMMYPLAEGAALFNWQLASTQNGQTVMTA
jgi:hypothetical protein